MEPNFLLTLCGMKWVYSREETANLPKSIWEGMDVAQRDLNRLENGLTEIFLININ